MGAFQELLQSSGRPGESVGKRNKGPRQQKEGTSHVVPDSVQMYLTATDLITPLQTFDIHRQSVQSRGAISDTQERLQTTYLVLPGVSNIDINE